MPLSDHEQRLLEQIERALYEDDPKFASSVRARDPRKYYLRRAAVSGAFIIVGLVVVLLGVALNAVYLGVIGFLVMLAAAWRALTAVKRLGSRSAAPAQKPSARPARRSRGSWTSRAEERWRRRGDEGLH